MHGWEPKILIYFSVGKLAETNIESKMVNRELCLKKRNEKGKEIKIYLKGILPIFGARFQFPHSIL